MVDWVDDSGEFINVSFALNGRLYDFIDALNDCDKSKELKIQQSNLLDMIEPIRGRLRRLNYLFQKNKHIHEWSHFKSFEDVDFGMLLESLLGNIEDLPETIRYLLGEGFVNESEFLTSYKSVVDLIKGYTDKIFMVINPFINPASSGVSSLKTKLNEDMNRILERLDCVVSRL